MLRNRQILITAAADGFLIRGLQTKLKGADIASEFSPLKTKELREKVAGAELIIVFTDEDLRDRADALMFINDYCAEKNAQVVVVGTKDEYGALCSYIPTGSVLAFYTRPLNMDVLVDRVSGYFDEESGEERKKSILIVDDDVSYMSMIMDWLKDKYRISIANSGMQAIMMLGKSKVDLILLDYEMPVTSGPQVLEMIRSNPSTADIPVMFLTGKGDKESIMKVLAFKPEGYMLKTIQREELKGNLEKFFKGRKA